MNEWARVRMRIVALGLHLQDGAPQYRHVLAPRKMAPCPAPAEGQASSARALVIPLMPPAVATQTERTHAGAG